MLTPDPIGLSYPDHRELSRRAAERHEHISAARAAQTARRRRQDPQLGRRSTIFVGLPLRLPFLSR